MSNLPSPQTVEAVLIRGDLSSLNEEQRSQYYMKVCESVGLNPLTKPFEYMTLNNKLVLYANKNCGEQLRAVHKISVEIPSRELKDGVYIVTARAVSPDGRKDEATGVVSTGNLKGDALANALMKAETKAKRRVTLSICSLGMLDETEIESIPGAEKVKDVTPAAAIESADSDYDPSKPYCDFCGAAMVLSKSKEHYFCPHWKDNEGKHSKPFKVGRLENYLDYQSIRMGNKENEMGLSPREDS